MAKIKSRISTLAQDPRPIWAELTDGAKLMPGVDHHTSHVLVQERDLVLPTRNECRRKHSVLRLASRADKIFPQFPRMRKLVHKETSLDHPSDFAPGREVKLRAVFENKQQARGRSTPSPQRALGSAPVRLGLSEPLKERKVVSVRLEQTPELVRCGRGQKSRLQTEAAQRSGQGSQAEQVLPRTSDQS